ncbi:MAG: hypothetical protein ABW136_00210, partial [Steroidobacteraceae bacterium]
MSVAAISSRPLITAAQLETRIEADTPVAILDAQLMQLADHPQRVDIDSLCELLAVLDQQHRRGRLDADDFRQLKARIAPLIVGGGARPAPAPQPRTAPALRAVPRAEAAIEPATERAPVRKARARTVIAPVEPP